MRRGWQILLGEATCSGSLCSLPVDEKCSFMLVKEQIEY